MCSNLTQSLFAATRSTVNGEDWEWERGWDSERCGQEKMDFTERFQNLVPKTGREHQQRPIHRWAVELSLHLDPHAPLRSFSAGKLIRTLSVTHTFRKASSLPGAEYECSVPDRESSLQRILGVSDIDTSPGQANNRLLPFGAEGFHRDPLIHACLPCCCSRRVFSVRLSHMLHHHLHGISGQASSTITRVNGSVFKGCMLASSRNLVFEDSAGTSGSYRLLEYARRTPT